MTTAERIGANIRAWRQRLALTQAELGTEIGSDGPRIGRLEKGAENPTVETLDKLAAALKIDVHQLITPRPEESGHESSGGIGGGAGLADSLRRAIAEQERTGQFPNDFRGDIMLAIFTLTRALQRSGDAAKDANRPPAANE